MSTEAPPDYHTTELTAPQPSLDTTAADLDEHIYEEGDHEDHDYDEDWDKEVNGADNCLDNQLSEVELVRSEPSNHLYRKPGWVYIGKGDNLCKTVVILLLILVVMAGSLRFRCDAAPEIPYLTGVAVWTFGLVAVMCFMDPGYFQRKDMDKELYDRALKTLKLYCSSCLTVHSDKVTHCYDCKCCVRGLDHHCGVFGVCIGKRTLNIFYLTILSAIGGLMFTYYCVFAYAQRCIMDPAIPTPSTTPSTPINP